MLFINCVPSCCRFLQLLLEISFIRQSASAQLCVDSDGLYQVYILFYHNSQTAKRLNDCQTARGSFCAARISIGGRIDRMLVTSFLGYLNIQTLSLGMQSAPNHCLLTWTEGLTNRKQRLVPDGLHCSMEVLQTFHPLKASSRPDS